MKKLCVVVKCLDGSESRVCCAQGSLTTPTSEKRSKKSRVVRDASTMSVLHRGRIEPRESIYDATARHLRHALGLNVDDAAWWQPLGILRAVASVRTLGWTLYEDAWAVRAERA